MCASGSQTTCRPTSPPTCASSTAAPVRPGLLGLWWWCRGGDACRPHDGPAPARSHDTTRPPCPRLPSPPLPARRAWPAAVNESNCGTLANLEDVDGFLVGGASLQGASFISICNAENKHS